MTLNPKIKEICEQHGVAADTAYIILLYFYHQLNDDFFEDVYHQEIQAMDFLGVIRRQYDENTTEFLIPLYTTDAATTEWNWVLDIRQMFINVRRDAGGTPKACITKMQKFFAEHPSVRTEDCMEAAKIYLSTITDPRYLQRFDYFITKTLNRNEKNSRLEEYLEIVKEQQATNQEIKIHL